VSINKENNLLNKKIVYDLTSFSHLDYPSHLSCIVWIVGCGFRCDYCYNSDIVFTKSGKYSFNDILSFLDTRINLLDAIVLSGGEATGVDLIPFCKQVKKKGFKIKLDTNGVNFEQIKKLLELKLLDYIALDYKAPKYKFTNITHSSLLKFDQFEQTLIYLINNNFDFEVRTTVHSDLLNENDINFIINYLYNKEYKGIYYLQNYFDSNNTIGNISKQQYQLNINQINTEKIKIQYRNF